MDLHQYDIFTQCVQGDPITELNGQATGRCKIITARNQAYVPVYIPKNTCPDSVNCDPKRFDRYCKPVLCRSLPLSNEEYLRKRLLNGNRPLSNSFVVQTAADTGKYRTTIWTSAGSTYIPSTADGTDLGVILPTPAPPVTGTNGTAIDSGLLTDIRAAIAGRGTISALDQGLRYDSFTTTRRKGLALITTLGPNCAFNQPCVLCDLSGTSASVIIGAFQCSCKPDNYTTVLGPFSLLWGQQGDGPSFASPCVSTLGKLVYVGSGSYVYALEKMTGNYIWWFENPFINDSFSFSNITVGPDSTVYVGGLSKYFFALDGKRGTLKWSFNTGDSVNNFGSKPCLSSDGEIIYVTSNGQIASVYAFNTMGGLLYSYTNSDLVSSDSVSSPTVGPDGSVYFSYDGKLVALTPDLTFQWSVSIGSTFGQYSLTWFQPTVDSNGYVYVGSSPTSSTLYCFNPNGTERWTYTASSSAFILSPMVDSDGLVYACVNNVIDYEASYLICFNNIGTILATHTFAVPGYSTNWIFATIDEQNHIYVNNIVNSDLIVLHKFNDEFETVKSITNVSPNGISVMYGSSTLSPPAVGKDGTVYWANGIINGSAIFGGGYPVTSVNYNDDAPPPVFRPNLRHDLSVNTVVPNTSSSFSIDKLPKISDMIKKLRKKK